MDEINRPAIHKEKKYDKQEDVIIGLSSIIFHDQRKLIRKKIQRQIISRLKSRTTFNSVVSHILGLQLWLNIQSLFNSFIQQ